MHFKRMFRHRNTKSPIVLGFSIFVFDHMPGSWFSISMSLKWGLDQQTWTCPVCDLHLSVFVQIESSGAGFFPCHWAPVYWAHGVSYGSFVSGQSWPWDSNSQLFFHNSATFPQWIPPIPPYLEVLHHKCFMFLCNFHISLLIVLWYQWITLLMPCHKSPHTGLTNTDAFTEKNFKNLMGPIIGLKQCHNSLFSFKSNFPHGHLLLNVWLSYSS